MDNLRKERGSQWHKWDFHIHTPYSVLNNHFSCNLNDKKSDSFDKYVQELFTRAIANHVSAIGITDYFSIDGYKRVREEYLDDSNKLSALFPDPETLQKVRSIYVFPNIELRLEITSDGKATINYHVIFSDEVPVSVIEDHFLRRLTTTYDGQTYPLTKSSMEEIGRKYKKNNQASGSDYKVGMERFKVDYKDIPRVLEEYGNFYEKYLITIPVDEDLPKISWTGGLYGIKLTLYKQCHCLLTPSGKTREWALAKGREEEQIAEFGSIKPCIWGSDAHSYQEMFRPAEDRCCWIKSDLSFEGLRQILYEPEERVRIQKDTPAPERPHQTIDHICFHDPRFQSEPIYFSDGLTCIIGGKSTGKSILLRHIARCAFPSNARKMEEQAGDQSEKMTVSAELVWGDGESGVVSNGESGVKLDGEARERKIVYVPQSLLNRMADDQTPDSPINQRIEELLLQNEEIKAAHQRLQSDVRKILNKVSHAILDYIERKRDVQTCEAALRVDGWPDAYRRVIQRLEEERRKLAESAGIAQPMERYNQLYESMSELQAEVASVDKELDTIPSLKAKTPFAYVPGLTKIDAGGALCEYQLNLMPEVENLLTETLQRINVQITETWNNAFPKILEFYGNEIDSIVTKKNALAAETGALKKEIEINDRIEDLEQKLEEERKNLKTAEDRLAARREAQEEADRLRAEILASGEQLRGAYAAFCGCIQEVNIPDTDLRFSAEPELKSEQRDEWISALFDSKSLRAFDPAAPLFSISSAEDEEPEDRILRAIWIAMENGLLLLKGGNTLQSALESLFGRDWYYIHYTVISGNDDIARMSAGKKALVLLEMLIHLESGNCPILLDQPEDDLDNRSVYSDLVQYLRKKKQERQIIAVTHNANVVVGADAEEVIIANQNGDDARNDKFQFEYRSGAIENNRPDAEKSGVLYQKGIQEQICDIMEGGQKAFEKRRNRYSGTRREE